MNTCIFTITYHKYHDDPYDDDCECSEKTGTKKNS